MAVSIGYKQAAIRRGGGPAKPSMDQAAHTRGEGKRRGVRVYGSNVSSHICCADRASIARNLRYLRVPPDASVREGNCASPRTENCEGRFAPHPVVVDGGALCVATARAEGDGGAGPALHHQTCGADIALPLLARSCHGNRNGGMGKRTSVGSRGTQLGACLGPRDHDLDTIDLAALVAIGHGVPGAAASRRRPAARQRDSRQSGYRNDVGLAACEAVRTIDRVQHAEPRRGLLPCPLPEDPRPCATALATGERKGQKQQRQVTDAKDGFQLSMKLLSCLLRDG